MAQKNLKKIMYWSRYIHSIYILIDKKIEIFHNFIDLARKKEVTLFFMILLNYYFIINWMKFQWIRIDLDIVIVPISFFIRKSSLKLYILKSLIYYIIYIYFKSKWNYDSHQQNQSIVWGCSYSPSKNLILLHQNGVFLIGNCSWIKHFLFQSNSKLFELCNR
nr:NADH-plastoquinone oxidoreductase subunit 6 [Sanicula orthacantha var. stolonifera]